MKNIKDKDFYLSYIWFLSGLIDAYYVLITELSSIDEYNFDGIFKDCGYKLKRIGERISIFLTLNVEDDSGIYSSLKLIKEYFPYYCETLNDSFPSICVRDAKYISDSLNTTKLSLQNKLKALKESLNTSFNKN